jgi:hypothetical protein
MPAGVAVGLRCAPDTVSAVLRGELIQVRGRKRAIDILFTPDHPDDVSFVQAVMEDAGEGSEFEDIDSHEADLVRLMRTRTFVVATKTLAAPPN